MLGDFSIIEREGGKLQSFEIQGVPVYYVN